MAIIADMNRPMIETAKDDRQTFTWGLATSLVLHGTLALVLLGGISGYVTEPGQDPVEVEIITLPAPAEEDAAAESSAEDQPQSEEQPEEQDEQEENLPPEPAPEQEETEEEEVEELPPEPAPAPEEETVQDQPPPSIQEAVQEFAEEEPEQQETDLLPLQDSLEEEVAEAEDTQEAEAAEALDEAQEIADAGTGDDDVAEDVTEEVNEEVVTSEPVDEPVTEEEVAEADTAEADVPEEEQPEQDVPEEQIAAAEETTPEAPSETEIADDFDPLAGPVSETETDVTPEPQPKPVELAEAGTEAAADVGNADEIAPVDFGTVGPILSAAPPAPKPARQVARATPSASSSASSSAGTVRRPGHIQARQIYSANNPRLLAEMRGISPGQRLEVLCRTELRAQLTAVSAVPPELVPRFSGLSGTVLEPRNSAFLSLGRWFNIDFRCETNSGVTRVESFSFKIGDEIPRSQWLRRGLSRY